MRGHENEKVQKSDLELNKNYKVQICKVELHAENNHYVTKTLKSKYFDILFHNVFGFKKDDLGWDCKTMLVAIFSH
jgi:hypothetical protein